MQVRFITALFASLVLMAATTVLLLHGVHVNTSLYDLLPAGGRNDSATHALERMARASSRQVNLLIKGDSEDKVLARARKIIDSLPEGIHPMTDNAGLSRVGQLLYQYRYQLLSDRHRQALETGDTAALKEEALANLYSFVPLSLYPVDEDPYGFATSFLLENPLVRQNGFEPRDGVLLTWKDGALYAYIPLMLPESAADSLDEMQKMMAELASLCEGDDVMLCGTPVHTWRASTSSQNAMSVLSVLSLLMIVALFLWVFSSLRGMLVMGGTLAAAGVVSLAAVVLLHGHVHILALVFGCSLVGISTDYVVHYLVGHHDSQDSLIAPPLKRSLLLGLLTSSLGYATFYAAQVDLLAQIATVSIAGLAAAMLFIFAFYPLLYLRHVPVKLAPGALKLGAFVARWHMPAWLPWGFAFVSVMLAVWKLPICDDLRSFYRPEPDLLAAEKQLAALNGMEQGMLTLLVRGEQTEEILLRQEMLADWLKKAGVPYFSSAAVLVPSAARQKENFERVKKLAAEYADDVPLDMPDTWPGALKPDDLLQSDSPFASLSYLWDSGCGLVLVPGQYRMQLQALPQQPWLEQADRFADLQQQVRLWREQLMWLMGIVGVLVLILLSLIFGPRSALCICGPVAAGVMAVFGGLALLEIPLTLFHVLACYLVLGLGCDYAIFRATHVQAGMFTALAVCVSFLTSWGVFGVLAFTDFSVTQDMGCAISLGLTVAYVLSPAATGAAKRRCRVLCEPGK